MDTTSSRPHSQTLQPADESPRAAIRRLAAEMAGHGESVKVAVIARRLGISRGATEKHVIILRAAGYWPHATAGRGDGPRKFDGTDRRLVSEIARSFGG